MRLFLLVLFSIVWCQISWGQCDPVFSPPLSPRIANYTIDVRLMHEEKRAIANEYIEWINTSPDTIEVVHMYMYLNAFKNNSTTFLRGASNMFGDDLGKRPMEEWGWINVGAINQDSIDLTSGIRYIQPDDGNHADQSVLQVPLVEPLLPGDTLLMSLQFTAKMPKTFVRTGYSKDDFFLFVHWFPQMGVYEPDVNGTWGWNCHQFHQSTEFYSDFGRYEVDIAASDHLVLGASGCLMEEKEVEPGIISRRYVAEDVIDFAWVAYPHFDVFEERWEEVTIRLLIPFEHAHLSDRYMTAMKQALEYLDEHVGPYPYPIITVMDPPVHALRSGLMEYPTFITAGSFSQIPEGLRSLEGLAVHEFAHQYFMGMVASNEKEEAWLDEGLVTYFEDRIIDHYYGEKTGYFDLWGYQSGNKEKTRVEYTSMENPKIGISAAPGWEIDRGSYKELVYAKVATVLHTLEAMVGPETTDAIYQTYFDRWKFKHPRGQDFVSVVNEVVTERHGEEFGKSIHWFFEQTVYDTHVCDYAVADISNYHLSSGRGIFDKADGSKIFQEGQQDEQLTSSVTLYRLGEMIFPQEVFIEFEDGTSKTETWSGQERKKVFSYASASPIIAAHIDPEQKIFLDLNLNNNSKSLTSRRTVRNKIAFKAIFWVQTILHTIGNLF